MAWRVPIDKHEDVTVFCNTNAGTCWTRIMDNEQEAPVSSKLKVIALRNKGLPWGDCGEFGR